jgi:MscS family membrane protein
MVDGWRQVTVEEGWAQTSTTSRGLLSLMSRAAKAAVAVIGIVAVLATLGYPVAALLGGLGLGGLAFALAAQKTLENLFGAVSIGADRLFREGDTVTIEGVNGIVEAIGLRSTRIRTPERTIVSMPNGKVADAKIEAFAPRDRIRFTGVLQLVYDTTAAQMRAVIAGTEQVLRSEPKVAPDTIGVFFLQLSPSSLDVQVIAAFQTTNGSEFQRIRQDVLLRIMDAVERAGTRFAFPTQTVHIASLPPAPVSTPAVDAAPMPPPS